MTAIVGSHCHGDRSAPDDIFLQWRWTSKPFISYKQAWKASAPGLAPQGSGPVPHKAGTCCSPTSHLRGSPGGSWRSSAQRRYPWGSSKSTAASRAYRASPRGRTAPALRGLCRSAQPAGPGCRHLPQPRAHLAFLLFHFPFSNLVQEKAHPEPPKQRAAAPHSSGVAQRCRIGPWGEGERAGQDKGLTLFIVRINVGVFNAGSLTPSLRRASLARRGQAAFSSPAAPKRG